MLIPLLRSFSDREWEQVKEIYHLLVSNLFSASLELGRAFPKNE